MPKKPNTQLYAEVARLYAEGLSGPQIADRLGFPANSLSGVFRRAGIKTRPNTFNYAHEVGPSLETRQEIATRYQTGTGIEDLAVEFGLNKETIKKALRRTNSPRRTRGFTVDRTAPRCCWSCKETKPATEFGSPFYCNTCCPHRKKPVVARERYLTLKIAQDSLCALCRSPDPTGKQLCLDHDHRTGKVRGLLCWYCNVGLGFLKDDPVLLQRAALYLRQELP